MSFSLKIIDVEAKLAKVNEHVCELQVGLKSIDEIKRQAGSTVMEDLFHFKKSLRGVIVNFLEKHPHKKGISGHDKYVMWRDMMAE